MSSTARGPHKCRWCAAIATLLLIFLLSFPTVAGPPQLSDDSGEEIISDGRDLSLDGDKGDEGFLGQLLVFLQPGTDPVAFGNANGLKYLDTLRSDRNAHIYYVGSQTNTTSATLTLSASASVRAVYENRRSCEVLYGFTPNDPYFHKDTPALGWRGQWHLSNEHAGGLDINVIPAWEKWMTGSGVLLGIVDDCLQRTHPDLSPNYVADDSYDFGQLDGDPSPVWTGDKHGIAVAGVAGARGGNSVGVTGAAPYAKLAGLRADFQNQTDAMFADATLYHSSGDNTNIKIKNHSYGRSVPYSDDPVQTAAIATSSLAGTIHVFAAGNDRGYSSQDSNTKMKQSSRHVIAVAAMGSNSKYASYSCFGANVFCTAPSSSYGYYGITTTDRTGTYGYNTAGGDTFPDNYYTSEFGGTSSASPTVAGALALAKQVQPALNKRFAKHVLVRSCEIVDATDATATSDGGWKTNGAGFRFNQNYGFGLVDADELCYQARLYKGVTGLARYSNGLQTVSAAIPDNSTAGVTRTYTTASTGKIEEVEVYLEVTHAYRGQIEAYLTSPSGTTSRLMYKFSGDSGDNIKWTFITNAFWGEVATGTWSLKVCDVYSGTTGTWDKFRITLNEGTVVVDGDRPTVTINQLSKQFDPTEAPYVYFRVDFSEWVTDFQINDIALSGTAGATTKEITSGAGRSYTVRVSGMTKSGTVIADIPAYGAHDARGNGNYASTSTDNVVTYNVKPKNLYISPSKGLLSDEWITITSAYNDFNGAQDFLKAYMLINASPGEKMAAYMMYVARENKVYLRNDDGSSWGTGYAPGTKAVLSNKQCALDVAQTSVAKKDQNMVIRWRLSFNPRWLDSLPGGPNGYLFVQDVYMKYDGWDELARFSH